MSDTKVYAPQIREWEMHLLLEVRGAALLGVVVLEQVLVPLPNEGGDSSKYVKDFRT